MSPPLESNLESRSEERGLRPIGSLMPKIEPLPSNSASNQTRSGRNIEITGSESRALEASRPTGGQLGAITAGGALSRALDGADAWATDKALVAALPPQIAQSLVSKVDHDFDLIGYTLKPGCDPAEARTALAIVDAACVPAQSKSIVQELAKLNAMTKAREHDETDMEVWYLAMADGLAEFPLDVIKEACRVYARCEKWRPSLSELREYCWPRFRVRESLRAELRRSIDDRSTIIP